MSPELITALSEIRKVLSKLEPDDQKAIIMALVLMKTQKEKPDDKKS